MLSVPIAVVSVKDRYYLRDEIIFVQKPHF